MVEKTKNKKCLNCGKESLLVSSTLGVCVECIREEFDEVKFLIEKAHKKTREAFDLPPVPPAEEKGLRCKLCLNECSIPPGQKSFCGLRENKKNKLEGASLSAGYLDWYFDNLPTNCVASWICAGGSEKGYPEFSYKKGPEYGYKNLAIFYYGCSFNCLFCQNWHWRENPIAKKAISPEKLVDVIDRKTSCICFFGGDPSCQITHSLKVAHLAREKTEGRIMRICWETNGSVSPEFLDEMAEISLESGGCIKFDLKAWNEETHLALCGVSNKRTLENFKYLASFIEKRKKPPFLIASTLLVPGYVDENEVKGIAGFISSLNPEIPYTLLCFYPQFYMHDLPTTSKSHAEKCLEAARKEGLKNVRIGNIHLLGNDY